MDFIRYRDQIKVSQLGEGLAVETVDIYTGESLVVPVDMVVLSTGMEPQPDQQRVASTFGVSLSPDGFFLERHPKLAPVETATDGVFLAGACQSPKDIPDTVAQGGAAASSALALMDAGGSYLGAVYGRNRQRTMQWVPGVCQYLPIPCHYYRSVQRAFGLGSERDFMQRVRYMCGGLPWWDCPAKRVHPGANCGRN